MSVDNSSLQLRNQILANSGLKGKALEDLKERLSKMSVQELHTELSRIIAGRGNNNVSRGLQIEHRYTKQTPYKTETFKDENGNNVTKYYDGEFLVSQETKTVYENGDVSETEVLYENGNPVVVNKNLNGKQIGHTEYEYDTRGYVKAIETNPNGEKRTISLLNVSLDGEWNFSDVIDINIERADGSTVSAYNQDGLVIEQNHFPNGRIVINTYNSDIKEYFLGKGKKIIQLAGDEKGLIKAEYDGRGNTYTYVNAGDGWEKLAKRFNMTVEQLKKANPKVKTLKAGQRILIPADIPADAKEFKGVQNPQYAKMVARNAEIKKRITEGIDKKYIDAIQKAGININAETATFFFRLKELNDTQRNNVINVIRYCKSQKINDINQIKAKILEMYPDINLFDSGKIIYPVEQHDIFRIEYFRMRQREFLLQTDN